MPNKPAVALDAPPPAEELLAAKAAGMTWLAWRDAGKPSAAAKSPTRCAVTRPWFPYRSKWESQYANHLSFLSFVEEIADWRYEPDKLLIGVGAVYTPDFRVTQNDGAIEYHEVKGYRREAAIVRIKSAALRYPDKRFVLVTKVNGEWHRTTIGATR